MDKLSLRTLDVQEMEKIEGGFSWAAFGCGLGLVACLAGQEYLIPTTAGLCSVAMS